MIAPLQQLEDALDLQSYEWLLAQEPDIAAAVEVGIARGATPEQIRRFAVRKTGRLELALRLEQAARYLLKLREV